MPIYTFYPFNSDGVAGPWMCCEFDNDVAALRYAPMVLAAHSAAVRVVVLQDNRQVAYVPAPRGGPPRDGAAAAIVESNRRIADSRALLAQTATRPYILP